MSDAPRIELPFEDDGAPDTEIVRRVLAGDTARYEVLMRRYNQRLFRTIRAVVRDDHEAEDVVQHAYVRAYDKLAQFRGDARFSTWLTRIALNEAMSRHRRTTRDDVAHLALVEPDEPEDPETMTQRQEAARLLERIIDDLPETLRVVFVLRDVEELDTKETAASLGLTDEAVRVRLHRARNMMRERLSSLVESAPDAFHFAGERCDRIVAGVLARLEPRER